METYPEEIRNSVVFMFNLDRINIKHPFFKKVDYLKGHKNEIDTNISTTRIKKLRVLGK